MSPSSSCPAWQAGFLAVMPAIQSHARSKFRFLNPEQRQDAIQEAVAAACVSYQRLAVRGLLHLATLGSLLAFSVRHVRGHRHVGGVQETLNDLLSPVAQHRHGIQVRHPDEDGEWMAVIVPDRRTSVPDRAAFRIDFARWLKTQGRRDRRIINTLVRGERTRAVAERFDITPGRVSQLRRRFQADWRRFQGEPVLAA